MSTPLNKQNLANIKTQIDSFDTAALKCPVTGKRVVVLCSNPTAPRQLLCASCLVNDLDFVKRFRHDLMPIEDIKPRLVEGIDAFVGSEPKQIVDSVMELKEKVRQRMVENAVKAFEETYSKKLAEFQEKLNEITRKINSNEAEMTTGTGQELKGKDWAAQPGSEVAAGLKSDKAAEVLGTIYTRLSSHPLVRAKLTVSEMLSYPEKEAQISIAKEASKTADSSMMKVMSALDLFTPCDTSCITRRWGTLNQAYNYQNGLNSLLFMVSEPSVFYGYSQYFTTGQEIPIKFKLVEGELANGNTVIVDFDTVIRTENSGQPERTLQGITTKTFPIFFAKPVNLKANIWYNISFTKPIQSHYIYYGSAPLMNNGERFQYGDNTKTITFRRANDDTIDNATNLGQFPDFYLR